MADPLPGPPGSAQWWLARAERSGPRRVRRDGITLDRVVAHALAIIDSEGAARLTLRRLADELHTGPASLYRHVSSREEILTLAVDSFLSPLSELHPPAGLDWLGRLRWLALSFRQHLLAHPNMAPLMLAAQMLGPNAMAGRQRALRAFLEAGMSVETAARAYLAIIHFTLVSAQLEARPTLATPDQRQARHELFAQQDPNLYPDVVANAPVLAELDASDEFEFGLDALLRGIEAGHQARRDSPVGRSATSGVRGRVSIVPGSPDPA